MKSATIICRVLMASMCFLAAHQLPAQTFTNLHNFAAISMSGAVPYTNADGAYLYSVPIVSGNTLYGATSGANESGLGGLYKINGDGSGFTNFFHFTFATNNSVVTYNGSNPFGNLVLSSNRLYGVTRNGSTNDSGSIFAINTDGTGFTNLYLFSRGSVLLNPTNHDGAFPTAGLVLSSNVLYGTTGSGGPYNLGSVFSIHTDGSGFTNLLFFNYTNGANPYYGSLVLSGSTLYGTTYAGGMNGNTNGTIFAVNTDGTGYTNLHSFTPLGYPYPQNSDGARPEGGLVLSGGTLYGVTSVGGQVGNGYGIVFSVSTNGNNFQDLHDFQFSDGAVPFSTLWLSGNTLFGTTTEGGANSAGTVFRIKTDGSDFSSLYSFLSAKYVSGVGYTNSTGEEPYVGVMQVNNTLFGVTPTGGLGGAGTLYALIQSGPPVVQLNAAVASGGLTLTWTNTGYTLQSTPVLGGAFTDVTGATSPYTIPTTNSQQFYRLYSN